MDSNKGEYIVFISLKDDKGKIVDSPLRPFMYEADANLYVLGYVDAIMNHTGEEWSEKLEAEVRGQFSVRNVAGDIVNNNEDKSSTNKETENV